MTKNDSLLLLRIFMRNKTLNFQSVKHNFPLICSHFQVDALSPPLSAVGLCSSVIIDIKSLLFLMRFQCLYVSVVQFSHESKVLGFIYLIWFPVFICK